MNATAPHLYVDCDVPDGLTLLEWRRNRRTADHHPSRLDLIVRRLGRLRH